MRLVRLHAISDPGEKREEHGLVERLRFMYVVGGWINSMRMPKPKLLLFWHLFSLMMRVLLALLLTCAN